MWILKFVMDCIEYYIYDYGQSVSVHYIVQCQGVEDTNQAKKAKYVHCTSTRVRINESCSTENWMEVDAIKFRSQHSSNVIWSTTGWLTQYSTNFIWHLKINFNRRLHTFAGIFCVQFFIWIFSQSISIVIKNFLLVYLDCMINNHSH